MIVSRLAFVSWSDIDPSRHSVIRAAGCLSVKHSPCYVILSHVFYTCKFLRSSNMTCSSCKTTYKSPFLQKLPVMNPEWLYGMDSKSSLRRYDHKQRGLSSRKHDPN